MYFYFILTEICQILYCDLFAFDIISIFLQLYIFCIKPLTLHIVLFCIHRM